MHPEPISAEQGRAARRCDRAHGGWAVGSYQYFRALREASLWLGEEMQEVLRRGDCELRRSVAAPPPK